MLHTNISVTHKPYLFNDAGVDVSSMFNDMVQPVVTSAVVKITPPERLNIQEEPVLDPPEQSNFMLAKSVTEHRNTLKSILAMIPLSALYLLHIQGETNAIDNDPAADYDVFDVGEQFQMLSMCYQDAWTSVEQFGLNSTHFDQAKRRLSDVLIDLPVSAEQLKALATLVTYAYFLKFQQCPQLSGMQRSIQAAILKRMTKLGKIDHKKLGKLLAGLGIEPTKTSTYTDFLVPPDSQTNKALLELINAEECWLDARQKLAQANSRLVLYLANQYKGGFLEFNDLVQEGQSGLLKAVDRFDYQRGFKFSTYAVYWIRQGISRSLTRNERVVRLPFGQMANISKVHRVKDAHFLKTGQELSVKELAEQTALSEAEINTILYISQTATSLDMPVGDDENATTLTDFLEQEVYEHPIKKIADQELSFVINRAIGSLSEKEAKVICCRFGINSPVEMTLEDIGHELNLTRERVRQIQVVAIKKLKEQFGAELISFLDA